MRAPCAVVLAALLAGCASELTVPGQCPDFCPSGEPTVREVVVPAIMGSDSSFFGYTGHSEVPALLVSNGLAAGEARPWYRFRSVPDTVLVGGTYHPYTIDSIAITFTLVARDSTKGDLVFDLYRLPVSIDTTITFSEIETELSAANWIDSLPVADSVRRGSVRRVYTGETLERLMIPVADSGKLALGVRVRGAGPTGARISSLASSTGTASFTTYARVDVTDTTLQKQTLSETPEGAGYVWEPRGPVDPDLLYLGDLLAARTLIRFELPPDIRDKAVLLRATLELPPARPVVGLPNDPAALEVRGVDTDLGAKSTPLFIRIAVGTLPDDGSLEPVSVDVLGIVNLWTQPDPPSSTLYLSVRPEGGSFHRPVFRSTRSAGGGPQLRISYLLPPPVEKP